MPQYYRKLAPLDPCPVEHVFGLAGGKWKLRILFRLSQGSASLAELGWLLPRARPQVLAEQLRQLEAQAIVMRLDPTGARLWGAFALTERGYGLCSVLDGLAQMGHRGSRRMGAAGGPCEMNGVNPSDRTSGWVTVWFPKALPMNR